MESESGVDDRSLVIRIRRQAREIAGAPSVWRGEVTDVLTCERRAFARPEDLLRFVAERIGASVFKTLLRSRATGSP